MRLSEYEDEFHSSRSLEEATPEIEVIGTVKRPGGASDTQEEVSQEESGIKRTCYWRLDSGKVCGIELADREMMVKHKRVHNNLRRLVCYRCDQTFKWRTDLLEHEASHATRERVKSVPENLDDGEDIPMGKDDLECNVEPEMALETQLATLTPEARSIFEDSIANSLKPVSESLDDGEDMSNGVDDPCEVVDVEPERVLESVENDTLEKGSTSQPHNSTFGQGAASEAFIHLAEEDNGNILNCSDPLALDDEEDQTEDLLPHESQTHSSQLRELTQDTSLFLPETQKPTDPQDEGESMVDDCSQTDSTTARCRSCDSETCLCGFAINMAKKARVVLDRNAELDRSAVRYRERTNNISEDASNGKPNARKRKVIIRLSKPSVIKDPKEKLIEDLMKHLGIVRGKAFNGLLKKDKDAVGSRFRDFLEEVSGGAIVPLLNFTLKRDDVEKLANLKGLHSKEISTNNCGCVKKEEEDFDEKMSTADADMQRTMQGRNGNVFDEDVDADMAKAVAAMQRAMQEQNAAGKIISDGGIVMEPDSSSTTPALSYNSSVNSTSSTPILPTSAPLSCSVCGDRVLMRSTDPPACHTCDNFFRIFSRESRGECGNDRSCVITKETRAHCKACRYDKCVSVGMKVPMLKDGDLKTVSDKDAKTSVSEKVVVEWAGAQEEGTERRYFADEGQKSDADSEDSLVISDDESW